MLCGTLPSALLSNTARRDSSAPIASGFAVYPEGMTNAMCTSRSSAFGKAHCVNSQFGPARPTEEPSGIMATSMKEFKPVIINGKTYQTTVIERFEGQVHSAYYLVRATDVLKFEVLEKDVNDWMEPTLKVEQLPEHKALQALLATLQSP